jgi:hypothetical protein
MTPMGRMMGKMMQRMGLDKSNKADHVEE